MKNQSDNFLDGFLWAVPTAFSDPLAACRFEQGDILYDTKKAYEGTWGEALTYITYSIQVKSPLRGIGTKIEKEEESVFSDNWNTTVEFTITDHKKHETKEVATTQGRLYSLLWKGDLRYINEDSPALSVPTLAMQILRDLPNATDYMRKNILKGKSNICVFLMPYDRTRQLLKSKFQKVEHSLKKFDNQIFFISPVEAGLTSKSGFAPTVSIACFCVHGIQDNDVELAIKKALYIPSKDKKTDKEQFRIKAHGYLSSI